MDNKTRMLMGGCVAAMMPLAVAVTPAKAVIRQLTRTENFNSDPGWDGHNNRMANELPPVSITNNFGYRATFSNAGGPPGEIGGLITPAGEPAYYAKVIAPLTLNDSFSASGTLSVGEGGGNTLLGFFNNTTTDEWRTANSLALRIYGRNSYFLGYGEYATSKWRAGAGGFTNESQFNVNTAYNWSLSYNPNGNGGGGTVTATIGSQTSIFNLDAGHKSDGATFNRFGFLNVVKSYDDPGSIYVDNLNVNGVTHTFGSNPNFEGLRNNITYNSSNVRPRFNFGYSNTNNAGGAASGELGGETFRGDSRVEFNGSRMAYYGDELDQTLTLQHRLRASGKVTLTRGVTDSTTHIGFFHSTDSIRSSDAQASAVPENFVGVSIEGPSSEGFNFYPTYNTDQEATGSGGNRGFNPAYIYPDSATHNWVMEYDPNGNGGTGRITVTFDGNVGYYNLAAGHKNINAHFDRFGIVTTHIDGNGQTVFLDDLTYSITDSKGDFNNDWQYTAADLDQMRNAVASSGPANPYDVNGDSQVNSADLGYLVESLLGTHFGDVDLDDDVDISDLAILANNYGQTSGRGWAHGNFDSDNDVDLNDLSTLAAFYGGGTAQAFADFQSLAVPEAGSIAGLGVVAASGFIRRRLG